MKTQRYGEFSLNLHRKVRGSRIPTVGSIEVTWRCPLKCAHCYNNLPLADREAQSREMTYEEHCHLLDEIARAGCLWLLYTGGEILARKDFLDIYTYAKRKGFLITLFTNGILITPHVADHLASYRPFLVEITLYGCTRETYEGVTKLPGSFDRCLRGIHLLLERGVPLRLKGSVMSINKGEVREMQRFAENLGLDFRFDAMLNPRIDCSQNPLSVRLRPEEVVELDLGDPKRMASWRDLSKRTESSIPSPDRRRQMYRCGAGEGSFAVDPSGKMSLCVLSHVDMYDLRRGSFREGWEDFLLKTRRRSITRVTKCTDCRIQPMCGMCPATGDLENGGPEEPVDFLCQVAHLRAYSMGIPVPPHGDCEYCEGSSGHLALLSQAAALKERAVGVQPGPAGTPVIPLIEKEGCGGCTLCNG